MYEVTIINGGETAIINAVSTAKDAPRIEGKVTEGINAINAFSFTISEGHKEYNSIIPFVTRVEIYDKAKEKTVFEGRVLAQSRMMNAQGICSKEYVCESQVGYLVDSFQEYEECSETTEMYLNRLLNNHNSQVEEYKRIYLGTVSENLNISIARVVTYGTTWSNINENIINKHGGELQLRKKDNILYLDYLDRIGQNSSTEIRLAHNLKDMNEETRFEGFYTRLIPLGAMTKKADENGNETDSGKRVTIESVNGNKKYIEDAELAKTYGKIYGITVFNDIENPTTLLQCAKETMAKQSLKISNKITAYDLYYLGLDMDNFNVGNTHTLINEKFDIATSVRIVSKTTDINNVMESVITIGEKAANINAEYEKKIAKAMENIQDVMSSLSREARDNIANAVNHATNMITGAEGGHVILDTEYNNGTQSTNLPWRILIMDTEDKKTAQNVLQLNKNGIGFSRNGIKGPYENAWTIDGRLVAEFITAAKLTAGTVGGWEIAEKYIVSDCQSDDGTYYRTYIQKADKPTDWVFSVQKSEDGENYTGQFYVTAEGKMYVTGNSTLEGDILINGNTTMQGELDVYARAKFWETITGNTSFETIIVDSLLVKDGTGYISLEKYIKNLL